MLNIYLKFDFNALCKKVLDDTFAENRLNFTMDRLGEITILDNLSENELNDLSHKLGQYGISIVENQKSIQIEKVKEAIKEMVLTEQRLVVKSSVYLSEKLNTSYGHISNLFTEITNTSIENYIIIQKIEYAKQLLNSSSLTLTEIAFKLKYSSVAHLSTQFKNTTGLTPSGFKRIISKRRKQL